MMDSTSIEDAGVLACDGNGDTKIHSGRDYSTITWDQVLALVLEPAAKPKTEAPAIIPSTYCGHDGRAHDAQRAKGQFIWAAGDIDKGNIEKAYLIEALLDVTQQPCDLAVYSTASSTPDDKRWRYLLRLSARVPGEDYQETQKAIFDLLEARDIKPDRTLARTGQLAYLPNIPAEKRDADGVPSFYDYTFLTGGLLDLSKSLIPARIEERRAAEAAKIAALKAEAEQRAAARAQRRATSGGSDDEQLIDKFNAENRIETTLMHYGFRQNSKGDWQSPYQAQGSGGYATKVFDSRWFSYSGSDDAAGLGQLGKKGGRWGDAWDLYRHFEHAGDHRAAFKAYGRETRDAAFAAMGPDAYVVEAAAEARRQQQRAENKDIGAEIPIVTMPEQLSLDQALARFVLATQGSHVVDLACPARGYALSDFRNAFAASRTAFEVTDKKTGEVTKKEAPTVPLWVANPRRHTVHSRTFRPGHGTFTIDPNGLPAANTWKPYRREAPSEQYEEHVGAFEGHVRYLFGEDADGFLDWISHIEQAPGVLPHRAVVHVSSKTGTGRNWVASVLTRVWRGHVAASFDLVGALRSGFNGELSSKLLAVVDELREGARSDQWEHSETLKKLITEERRSVNFKYGQQVVEYNCCRILAFSNSLAVLPIAKSDRRLEVTVFDGDPKPESEYGRLYGLLNRAGFVNDIAVWLGRRDLTKFNPGARAKNSAGKARVIQATTPEGTLYAQAVVDHWPSDIIANGVLSSLIDPRANGYVNALVKAAAAEVGMRPRERPVWTGATNVRAHIVRNHERWLSADGSSVTAEMQRAMSGSLDLTRDWRSWLDGIVGGDFG